jgi:telomere length regulation protein
MESIRGRLHDPKQRSRYSAYWASIFIAFSSIFTLKSVLVSLFSSLSAIHPALDASPKARSKVKKEATVLRGIVSLPSTAKEDLWEAIITSIFESGWREGHARLFVCWVAGEAGGNEACGNSLLDHS